MKQINIFDEDNRLKRLSEMGDPLEKAASAIDWEIFRPTLKEAFSHQTYGEGHGGRKPWDTVLMFKILMLQKWNNIADDKTEYLINDRLSYQRFLGLALGDKVPDAKTIWLYRETLRKSGRIKELFELFGKTMEQQGIVTRKGSIAGATFAEAPRQRNKRDENEGIRNGKIPEEWTKPENKAKLSQKDTDAMWTSKSGNRHYGYKNHVKCDSESKIILGYAVTGASVHDSQAASELIDDKDRYVCMDSAYSGKAIAEEIKRKTKKPRLIVQEKAYRNRPLAQRQEANNRRRSKKRCRIEHIFCHIKTSMGGLFIRSIGIDRAAASIGLTNLAYNMKRYEFLTREAKPIPT